MVVLVVPVALFKSDAHKPKVKDHLNGQIRTNAL
jgi:hypothetical protein